MSYSNSPLVELIVSCMGGLFSKQKGPEKAKKRQSHGDDEVSDKDKAVLELKNARDRLKKYRKQVQ